MTLIQLIEKADRGYRKGFCDESGENCLSSLLHFVEPETGEPRPDKQPGGDSLALCVVHELNDTFDPAASDEDQLAEAVRVVQAGRDSLDDVIDALNGT